MKFSMRLRILGLIGLFGFSVQTSHGMMSGIAAWVATPALKLVGGYVVEKATAKFIQHSLHMVRNYNETAFDAFVAKCQERSDAKSAALNEDIKQLLAAFRLVDDEGNITGMVRDVVLTSIINRSCSCNYWCLCMTCCRATPVFFKIGGVIVEKTALEFIRRALVNVQTYNKDALRSFVTECERDGKNVAKKIQDHLRIYNLVDENGKIPAVVKEVVNGLVDGVAAPSRGGPGSTKPSQQKIAILSVKNAIKAGKFEMTELDIKEE